jgi:hypothetical protein
VISKKLPNLHDMLKWIHLSIPLYEKSTARTTHESAHLFPGERMLGICEKGTEDRVGVNGLGGWAWNGPRYKRGCIHVRMPLRVTQCVVLTKLLTYSAEDLESPKLY